MRRAEIGADQVTLAIRDEAGIPCGVSFQPQTINPSIIRDHANTTITYKPSCLSGGVFAHEAGHNLTMAHDVLNFYPYPYFPFAYGFATTEIIFPNYEWAGRSIMAYPPDGGPYYNVRFPGYSSPELVVNGVTLGSETANNALTFETVAPIFTQNMPTVVQADSWVDFGKQSIFLPGEPVTIEVRTLMPQSIVLVAPTENLLRWTRARTDDNNQVSFALNESKLSPSNTYAYNVNGGQPQSITQNRQIASDYITVTAIMPGEFNPIGLQVESDLAHHPSQLNSNGMANLQMVPQSTLLTIAGPTVDKESFCYGEANYVPNPLNQTIYINMKCGPSHTISLPLIIN